MSKEVCYVICVDIADNHMADSVQTECVKCKCKLWISPHHVVEARRPLCIRCVKKLVEKEKPNFTVDPRDMMRAFQEIAKVERGN